MTTTFKQVNSRGYLSVFCDKLNLFLLVYSFYTYFEQCHMNIFVHLCEIRCLHNFSSTLSRVVIRSDPHDGLDKARVQKSFLQRFLYYVIVIIYEIICGKEIILSLNFLEWSIILFFQLKAMPSILRKCCTDNIALSVRKTTSFCKI